MFKIHFFIAFWVLVALNEPVYAQDLFAQVNLDSGLVAYYPFNGNANDESGNGNHGTVNGATLTTDRFGNENSAYSFDGVNDYIVSIDSIMITGNDDRTMSGWFYTNEINNLLHPLVFWGFDNNSLSMVGIDWRNKLGFMGFFTNFVADTQLNPSQWYHFAFVSNNGTRILYLNGIQDGVETDTTALTTNSSELEIGRYTLSVPWDPYYNGVIDDIRIYERALSEEEILELYQIRKPEVISIDPTSGLELGGTPVTIVGSNFQSGATVNFDGSAATGVVVVSDTVITAVTPAHPAGTVDVIVTNPDGQSTTLRAGFAYEVPGTGIIVTVAGTGVPGFTGDGGPATGAQFQNPFGLEVDSAGNLFIADRENWSVRRVDTLGIISTVAGSSTRGSGGDGGTATAAQLELPVDVALDAAANLFISDREAERVRKVDPQGIITTFAGVGSPGFSGDGGPATSAAIDLNRGITVDAAGNLYIADSRNHRIRKVDTHGIITTVAGSGSFGFADPGGFSGDGGPATSARLSFPNDVVVDPAGNLFIADRENHRVRMVDPITGIITTVVGTGVPGFGGDGGPATSARINNPTDLVLDGAGNLYIADELNHRVRNVDTQGIITTIVGTGIAGFSGDSGLATSASLRGPRNLAINHAGDLFISDVGNNRVRKVFRVASPPAPHITSITPSSGLESGGTPVRIAGSNFQSGATVTFGDSTASNVAVGLLGTITATTPAHPAGTVDVIVTNPDTLADTLFNGFEFIVPPPVVPVDTVSVSFPDTSVFIDKAGISVPVVIKEDATGLGIISVQMSISYDSNVIETIDVTSEGTLTQGWTMVDTIATGVGTSVDTVKIAMATTRANALSGSGNLSLITFVVSDSAVIGDSTAVVFEEFFFNEGDPAATTTDGSVRILERLFGDVSNNGRVTAFDAALVLEHTVRLYVITDTITADVSGDGTISSFDASYILRFAIGIITEFPVQNGGISKIVLAERNISIGDVEDLSDGRFAVPILIDEMDGVLSGQLELSFDPTKLKDLYATTSDLTSDYLFDHNAQNGRLRLSFAGVESVRRGGSIAEIIFEPIDSGIEASSGVDIVFAQLNEGLFSVVIPQSESISDVPDSYSLYQNYPNPFNPETVIHYDLPLQSHVKLSVFNLMGQKVATLVDGHRSASDHSAVWNGKDNNGKSLASGVYLYRMETDGFVQTRKLILLR